MAVLRINKKEKNFLILDKTCLNEKGLSWGAKGLHAYLMSLPQDWILNVADLKKRATNGRDSVRGLLIELEKAGYISKEWVRNEISGKYKGIEYVVHELPNKDSSSHSPETENPETDNPSPVKPVTENPTLININSTKDPDNKVLMAAASILDSRVKEEGEKNPAANSFFTTLHPKQATPALHSLPPKDLIGESLSDKQMRRIEALVQALEKSGIISNSKALKDEISFCLLSPKRFKACKQDFSHKINAIRTVILRGDWQTPSEMLVKAEDESNPELKFLEKELQTTYAEIAHFQRLLKESKTPVRKNFETIIANAEIKILKIEKEIESLLVPQAFDREGQTVLSA